MRNIGELLREADPLQDEPILSPDLDGFRRQATLATGSGARTAAGRVSRRRMAAFAGAALLVIAASFLGARVSSLFVGEVEAAVRFEVRLAEDKPGPGLREAKVSASDRSVYVHDEAIVTNSDIAAARIVQGNSPSRYGIGMDFNASGAAKMRAATMNHIGKPVAILLDGQVVVAPVLRSPISEFAIVNGNYTRAQAEKIVNGVGIQ